MRFWVTVHQRYFLWGVRMVTIQLILVSDVDGYTGYGAQERVRFDFDLPQTYPNESVAHFHTNTNGTMLIV